MDNASIHHVCEVVEDLIVNKAHARLCYLPPYSPDLMPAEGVFSQVKSIIKHNHQHFQVCYAPSHGIWLKTAMATSQDAHMLIAHSQFNL